MREWQPDPTYKLENECIVCAACISDDGFIVTGARHLDDIMRSQIKAMKSSTRAFSHPKNQGFINQFGHFLSRAEAWIIADKRGQIIRDCVGSDDKILYSENLY